MPAPCPDVVRSKRPVAAALLALALAATALFASPAAAHASDVLKHGSRGPAVVELQRKLDILADGLFGRQTARAVRRFQARKGLTVDGVVGSRTAAALGLDLASVKAAGHAARPVSLPPVLDRIAACESGGNPRAVSPDGAYRGKYQFTFGTWHAMGGSGDPARAPEAEQDRRALALLHASGTAPWPSCGA